MNCHHTDFYTCFICVTTRFKRLIRYVYGKCCHSIEKKIIIKCDCNKWYNAKFKIVKRNTRHAKKEIWAG